MPVPPAIQITAGEVIQDATRNIVRNASSHFVPLDIADLRSSKGLWCHGSRRTTVAHSLNIALRVVVETDRLIRPLDAEFAGEGAARFGNEGGLGIGPGVPACRWRW